MHADTARADRRIGSLSATLLLRYAGSGFAAACLAEPPAWLVSASSVPVQLAVFALYRLAPHALARALQRAWLRVPLELLYVANQAHSVSTKSMERALRSAVPAVRTSLVASLVRKCQLVLVVPRSAHSSAQLTSFAVLHGGAVVAAQLQLFDRSSAWQWHGELLQDSAKMRWRAFFVVLYYALRDPHKVGLIAPILHRSFLKTVVAQFNRSFGQCSRRRFLCRRAPAPRPSCSTMAALHACSSPWSWSCTTAGRNFPNQTTSQRVPQPHKRNSRKSANELRDATKKKEVFNAK